MWWQRMKVSAQTCVCDVHQCSKLPNFYTTKYPMTKYSQLNVGESTPKWPNTAKMALVQVDNAETTCWWSDFRYCISLPLQSPLHTPSLLVETDPCLIFLLQLKHFRAVSLSKTFSRTTEIKTKRYSLYPLVFNNQTKNHLCCEKLHD